MGMIADAGEDIEDLAAIGTRVTNAVGCEQWQVCLIGESNEETVEAIFTASMMPLQFNIDLIVPERLDKTVQPVVGSHILPSGKCARDWPFIIASERNQTL